jgi:hypothetical protein
MGDRPREAIEPEDGDRVERLREPLSQKSLMASRAKGSAGGRDFARRTAKQALPRDSNGFQDDYTREEVHSGDLSPSLW